MCQKQKCCSNGSQNQPWETVSSLFAMKSTWDDAVKPITIYDP